VNIIERMNIVNISYVQETAFQ